MRTGIDHTGSFEVMKPLLIPFLCAASLTVVIAADPSPVPIPTAGGWQLWSDFRVRDGFRLQQNAVTGRWRVIDADNVRRAGGNRADCLAVLEDLRPWTAADDDGRTVTVLLHGLMRTRRCMGPLADRIDAGGGRAVTIGYASTRLSVAEHAAAMAAVIADWPDSWRLKFVGHSMGNIVTRHWIGDQMKASDPVRRSILDRCESMVMLGPPNQGSAIARRMAPTGVFGIVAGRGGMQMGENFEDMQSGLATPPFRFTIIAGDISHYPVGNPLIDSPNDLLVTVEETRLAGAAEHIVVPVPHAMLMRDASVIDRVIDAL